MTEKMARRLVVTGHNAEGASRVVSDTEVRGVEVPGIPDYEISQIWGSDKEMDYPDDGEKPEFKAFFPPRGGYRFVEVCIPARMSERASQSDIDLVDPEVTLNELEEKFPGMAETMSPDDPGMHRTATVDLIVVLEGQCTLRLDEGEVALSAGDLLIQSGTMHAWQNPNDEPCRFIAAIIGAKNE